MQFETEFFVRTNLSPEGKTVHRHVGDFADADAATNYALEHTGRKGSATEVDGFRLYANGVFKKSVSIRSGVRDDYSGNLT